MMAARSTAVAQGSVSPRALNGRFIDALCGTAAFSGVGIVSALASAGRKRATAAKRTTTAAVPLMTVQEC